MSKTVIYYFSATGNSKHAANTIAASLDDCLLYSIPELSQESSEYVDAAAVGIITPTHYFGIPPLVADFIKKLKFSSQVSYIFSVVTSGSSSYLNSSLNQLKKLILAQGKELDAGYHVRMISSYIPLSDIPPTEKQQHILAAADKKIGSITRLISARAHFYDTEGVYALFHGINQYWQRHLLPSTHTKFICKESCTGCGTCERVCPVKNIVMADRQPHWNDNCQECLACLHACPSQSIEFGKRTTAKKRYRHPRVQINELFTK